MKKTLFIINALVLLASSASIGQTISLRGGMNIANVLERNKLGKLSDDYGYFFGPHFGLMMTFETGQYSRFETGLMLTGKGYKMTIEDVDEVIESNGTISLYYINIPIQGKVKRSLGRNTHLCLSYGPYIDIGIFGKLKVEQTLLGQYSSKKIDIEWGSNPDEDDLIPFDLGMAIGLEVETRKMIFGLKYNYGLSNISANTRYEHKIKNWVFSISIGYKLVDNLWGLKSYETKKNFW